MAGNAMEECQWCAKIGEDKVRGRMVDFQCRTGSERSWSRS